MNQKLRALCLLLSMILLVGLCACGSEPEEDVVNKPIDPNEYFAENSYHVNRLNDGTYSYSVVDFSGNAIFERENQPFQPTFTPLSDQLLQVTAKNSGTTGSEWAAFCDVRTGRASKMFGNFLSANTTHVAYWDYLTEKYHVFVANIFEPDTDLTAVTLEGLTVSAGDNPIKSCEKNETGDLVITYSTKDGDKTATVDMP